MLNEAYAGQTFAREEVRILTKEGKLRWHAFTINPLFDEEGKQLGVEVSERGINRLKMAEFALRESEERYRSLVDLSPDAICLTSLEGNIIIANQQAVKLYNAESVRDLLGKDIAEFITETSHGSLQDQFKFCLQNGRVKGQEYAIRKDDTTQQLVEISVSLIRDMDGYPDGFITVTRDITERKKAERAILETNRKLETLVQATPLAVVALDRHNRVTIWNSAAEKMFGWSSSEVIGKELPYLTADILEEHNSHMTLSVQGETINGAELTRKTKTGETLVISLSTAPLHDSHNNITGYVAVMQDITEKKKIEKQLVDLAFFDQLTGLPNRTLFHDRLSQALSHAQQNDRKVALLFVDLDRFKTINDSLGHVIGDTLLALVGERLNSCVKQNDTVSRQGGDEFTIILTDIAGEKEAATTASKIIDVLEEPFTIESHEVFITPSIGISIYPTDTEEPATMIRFADVAMYSAKRRGGDLFQFYTSDMNARVLERLNVENNLRKAMRREEFVVFYQPKYDLHTGKIVSAESLVRWNSRELGLVSPLRFIPVAEETGMIVEIDTFVMRTACKEAKKWQKAGYPDFRIAVNITPQELTPKLINTVENALNEAGLEPQYLEIEITEGGIMQVDDQILKIISDIRARGVKIAVDDFGTGYSTLSRLKDLEADLVKIDQSFIRNVCTNDRDAAIVSSMVTLAHNLGLKVVAEGVENEQTSNLLKSFGCDEIQGYLISPPVSDDQFPGLLDQYNTK
jgi:diguanylate cyclase (GGDEF)-like protein/PAS domain S-box-containing protein